MADILIYWTDHWMDNLTSEQITEYSNKYPHFLDKYNARPQRGDIVSIYPDNRLADTQHGNKFVILRIPELTVEQARIYLDRLFIFDGTFSFEGLPNMKLVKKHKFQLNVDALPVNIKNVIEKKRIVTLTSLNFTTNIIEKTY